MNDTVITGKYCSNCGNELIDLYCQKCGQKKFELKDKSVKAFVLHFIEEFFTFDSKFFRTIKYLLFKPGYLTHEYISGRFVRYVTPLKLYLFTSIITIFIMFKIDPDVYSAFMEPRNDGDPIQNSIQSIMESKGLGEDTFRIKFNNIVNDNVTLNMFFIMIIFSIILKLAYIYKNIYYVEHLVFTLHFFTMVLICFSLQSLFPDIDVLSYLLIFILPVIYLSIALKRVYHQSWLKAIFPALFLSFIFIILIFMYYFIALYEGAVLA